MPEDHTHTQDNSNTPTRIVIFLFITLALIALMGVALSTGSPRDNKNMAKDTPKLQEPVNLSPHTLIYGTWSADKSIIIAYDLASGWEGVIATLPEDIKHVSVVPASSLIYINNTDQKDHGNEIVQFDLTSGEEKVIYRASDGFGIDKYVLSNNKERLAVWEVKLNAATGKLSGGNSRVYSALVGHEGKNLIYDEVATSDTPVNYPIAILDNGTIFTDKFLPNSGTGWAYGMTISNFIGTNKKDIESMQNGTYGTVPVLSPDGNFFAFAGYSNQAAGVTGLNGYRRSIVSPNTVEVLNINTLERSVMQNLSQNSIYTQVQWDADTSYLYISSSNRNESLTGTLEYNLTTGIVTPIPQPDNEAKTPVRQLTRTIQLTGDKDLRISSLGNIGQQYELPYSAFAIFNQNTLETSLLQTTGDMMQLIDVIPSTSFGSFRILLEDSEVSGKNIPAKTISAKFDLEDIRAAQQSTRVNQSGVLHCKDYIALQIAQNCGTPPSESIISTSSARQKCSDSIINTNKSKALCY